MSFGMRYARGPAGMRKKMDLVGIPLTHLTPILFHKSPAVKTEKVGERNAPAIRGRGGKKSSL
jgi:hypothetical protein